MSAMLDQKLGRIASSMPSGSPVLTPGSWNKSRRQQKKERQQQQATWQEPRADLDAQAPAPAAVPKGNKGKGKQQAPFKTAGTDAKGKQGKGKGSKGGTGGGKGGKGPVRLKRK
jgi:hypothetical protein